MAYGCMDCGRSYSRPEVLAAHLHSHSSSPRERLYECSVCWRRFRRRRHLADHERSSHGPKPYECLTCRESFYRLRDIDRHHEKPCERLVDRGPLRDRSNLTGCRIEVTSDVLRSEDATSIVGADDPVQYRLSPCEKLVREALFGGGPPLAHCRLTFAGKRVRCPECDRSFRSRKQLADHMRMTTKHAGPRGGRSSDRHECPRCGKCFLHRHHLEAHRRTHSDWQHRCRDCGKDFPHPHFLANHQRNYCGRSRNL